MSGRSRELSGGILYRGDRGCRLATHTTIERKGRGKGKRYHHYRCPKRRRHGVVDSRPNAGHRRAEPLEDKVWGVVAGLLKDPERVRGGPEELIARERESYHEDPEREPALRKGRPTEVEAKRSRFQEMAAEGLVTLAEPRAKLGEPEDARRIAEAEAKTLRHRADRARDLEPDKETLLSTYAELAPEQPDALTSDERRRVHGMLRLRWEASADGTPEGRGLLSENLGVLRGRGLREDEPTFVFTTTARHLVNRGRTEVPRSTLWYV